jgi:hypothetical protein
VVVSVADASSLMSAMPDILPEHESFDTTLHFTPTELVELVGSQLYGTRTMQSESLWNH